MTLCVLILICFKFSNQSSLPSLAILLLWLDKEGSWRCDDSGHTCGYVQKLSCTWAYRRCDKWVLVCSFLAHTNILFYLYYASVDSMLIDSYDYASLMFCHGTVSNVVIRHLLITSKRHMVILLNALICLSWKWALIKCQYSFQWRLASCTAAVPCTCITFLTYPTC